MIVQRRPNAFRMLFILKGSILPQILPQLLTVIGLSALISGFDRWLNPHLTAFPVAAFSLIGLTLSIFLGFRNNACYERWWEGRKLWGSLIAQIRHLCRDTRLLPAETRKQILYRLMVFSHLLKNQLRQTAIQPANYPAWLSCLPISEQQHYLQPGYSAQYVLDLIHQDLLEAMQQHQLSDICYIQLNQHVIEIANIKASCERLHNTPLPFAYSLLLHRTAYIFCLLLPFGLGNSLGFLSPVIVAVLAYTFFGLDALGNELEDPFGVLPNNLPLDAMVRVIEIDVLSALNSADIPKPLQPVDYVLS